MLIELIYHDRGRRWNCYGILLLAKLRKAQQKKEKKSKGSTGFIRYCKTDLKKDCSSLFTLIESRSTNLRSNPDKFLAFARMSLASFDIIQSLISHLMKNNRPATTRKTIVNKTTGSLNSTRFKTHVSRKTLHSFSSNFMVARPN